MLQSAAPAQPGDQGDDEQNEEHTDANSRDFQGNYEAPLATDDDGGERCQHQAGGPNVVRSAKHDDGYFG